MNIAQPFLTRARSHPELKAVTHAGQTVLFGELARRILGLAGSLQQAKKLESGARVLIFMENRREAMEVLLATWAAGFCAVPVNAKLHPKEVKPIANDSGARIIFTSQSLYLGLHQELSGELDACEILSVDDLEY
jgi:acyl-CoA synthetase (AMP-forming)/AMP-acid ligase II